MGILVTGAGGFVGAALTRSLLEAGYDVIAMDRHLAHLPAHPRLNRLEGDICSTALLDQAFEHPLTRIMHLAALPGASAERDHELSMQVNLIASHELMKRAANLASVPRFVFSSTIAVFGDPMPAEGVNDQTPLRPRLIYGMHKLMTETMLATFSRRGMIDGVGVRLPGIMARPAGDASMKSAFMSDVFHALRENKAYELPVSPGAQLWVMSLRQCVKNLTHALNLDSQLMPDNRVVTLPAMKIGMAEMVEEIASQTGSSLENVSYNPDQNLESAFGAHPDLSTPAAEKAGFSHDGSKAELVRNALIGIEKGS